MIVTDSRLIDLVDVTYAPEGTPVLRGITLQSSARRIGIVGRNGSGKTSLARVMAGLVPTTSGTVRIAGVDVAKDRKAALKVVGILFQNPDHQIIFPTVEEEIAFGLQQMRLGTAEMSSRVDAVLQRFDRAHWAKAAIHQLSQGQRQLVCLMSVLAMQPQVIILDEPFAGLDIPTRLQLGRVLAGIDATLVQITHDPATLQGYEQVFWVQDGAIHRNGAESDVCPAFIQAMTTIGARDDFTDITG